MHSFMVKYLRVYGCSWDVPSKYGRWVGRLDRLAEYDVARTVNISMRVTRRLA